MDAQISFRVSNNEYNWLTKMSKKYGMTKSEVLRMILDLAIKNL